MPLKSYRKESRLDWSSQLPENVHLDDEKIKLGAILRIADAAELMASNYTQLQSERDMYKKWWLEEQQKTDKLQRQVNAYKGIINRNKKNAK